MMTPRLRMVAGPNGSGKTTLLHALSRKFTLGHALNPDDVQHRLQTQGFIPLGPWGLTIDESTIRRFLENHPLGSPDLAMAIKIERDRLVAAPTHSGGYAAAIICDFLRRQWLAMGVSFTFETVMSSRDKLELLAEARASGYRTYLYYICTDAALINRERVAARVREGGHDVPREKIESRYDRSLALLKEAIALSTRAYLFDNSGQEYRLLAEFENDRLMSASKDLPGWIVRSVLTK